MNVPDNLGEHKESVFAIWLMVGFAILFRVLMLLSNPIQEIDYYRYLWDGKVCWNGLNPYEFSPEQIQQYGPKANPDTKLSKLWKLAQESPSTWTIFWRVHHRKVPTVYPPVAQYIFAIVGGFTPKDQSVWIYLLILKMTIVGFDLGTVFLLVALLRQLKLPALWAIAYAWCPLVIKEIANSAHLDSIAIFLSTLSVLLVTKVTPIASQGITNRDMWCSIGGLVSLGGAVLAKSYPLILLPVFVSYLFKQLGRNAIIPIILFFSIIIACYVPFIEPPNTSANANPNATSQQIQNNPFTGLGTFLRRWQMNDLLFMVVHENLRLPTEDPPHWFVVVSDQMRISWHQSPLVKEASANWFPPKTDPALVATQIIMGVILLVLCLWFAWKVFLDSRPIILVRAVFWTLIWGWLLASAQNPWYLLWSLPFMVFDTRRSWFLLTGLVFLYYIRFWIEYQNMNDPMQLKEALRGFDFGIVWIEYTPFFVALILERLFLNKKEERSVRSKFN